MSERRDLIVGLFFLTFGLLLVGLSLQYSAFTFRNLGPGFLPLMYAMGLTLCGGFLTVQGIAMPAVEVEPFKSRGLVFVTLAILFFAGTINNAGLFVAGAGTVLLAAWAGGDFRWKEVTVLTIGILICAYLLFIRGLGLPILLSPRF